MVSKVGKRCDLACGLVERFDGVRSPEYVLGGAIVLGSSDGV